MKRASPKRGDHQVILSAARPEIITAMRVGMVFGRTMLAAAEIAASRAGPGYMVLSASKFLQTATVIMGIIVNAAIAHTSEYLMRLSERHVVLWKGHA